MSIKISWNKYFTAILVFIISLTVYLLTLSPTVNWGDSGEFIVVSYYMGIAHPTGYPLYTLLGKLFTFIPLKTVAFRVNLMSAFFASLTCLVLYLVTMKLTNNKIVSIITGLTFGFSYTLWSQAIIAEVYTLHTFFMALLILMILNYKETRNIRFLYLFSIFLGLSFSNHIMLTLILFPGFIYFILTEKQIGFKIKLNKDTVKRIILFVLLFLIGLIPYIYLPIRSYQKPSVSSIDFTKLSNIFIHIRGGPYTKYLFELPFNLVILRLMSFIYFLLTRELIFVGLFLGIFGMFFLYKKNFNFLLFSLLTLFINLLINSIYPISGSNEEIWVWYIPIIMILTIYMGVGLNETIKSFIKKKKKIFMLLFIIIPLLLLVTNYKNIDKSNDYSAAQYADVILKTVKNNSIIITKFGGQDTNTLLYMNIIEGKRKDVFIDYYKFLLRRFPTTNQSKEAMNSILFEFMKKNIDEHPIYITNKQPKYIMHTKNFTGALLEIKKQDLQNKTKFLNRNLFTY